MLLLVPLLAGAAALLAACSSSSTGSAAAGHSTPTTATTARPAPTTTAVPSAPQSSADAAADALVDAWSNGDRAQALTVATPAAVATLFALPYQSGLAIDRGCSDGPPPTTCTFGPPGGADPNDPIYSLQVTQSASGGWYVISAQEMQ